MSTNRVIHILILASWFNYVTACSTITTEGGTRRPEPCQFPFIYDGKTFNDCTRTRDPDNRLWCSVETDSDGKHVTGRNRWGYCNPTSCGNGNSGGDGARFPSQDRKTTTIPRRGPRTTVGPKITQKSTTTTVRTTLFESSNININGQECNTVSGKESDRPCVFPFTFKGVTYTECTLASASDGFEWCSTEINALGEHVKGHWGHCLCRTGPVLENEEGQCLSPRKSEFRSFRADGTFLPDIQSNLCGSLLSLFIVGGEDADVNLYPFATLLGFRRSNGALFYFCGGTLINRRYVMTAAHCFDGNREANGTIVTLGEYDTRTACDCNEEGFCSPEPQMFTVEELIIHESWTVFGENESQNDIALIRLSDVATITQSVRPVCLPVDQSEAARQVNLPNLDDALEGQLLTAIGWGRTMFNSSGDFAEGGFAASSVLQHVQLPGFTRANCENIIRNSFVISPVVDSRIQMCAGNRGISTCSGDSGGALILEAGEETGIFIQLGITSYGSPTCGDGIPGVYTRVSGLIDWIQGKLRP